MLILGFYSEFYRKEAILGKFWVVSKYKMLKIIPKVRVNTLEVEKITLGGPKLNKIIHYLFRFTVDIPTRFFAVDTVRFMISGRL